MKNNFVLLKEISADGFFHKGKVIEHFIKSRPPQWFGIFCCVLGSVLSLKMNKEKHFVIS